MKFRRALPTLLSLSALAASAATMSPAPAARLELPPWELMGTSDGITVSRRETPGSAIIAFRGECVIPASIGKVAAVLADTPRHKEWVERLVEARVIRSISEVERVEYNRTSAPWPLSDRDFLFRWTAKLDPAHKRLVTQMHSVEDPTMPARSGVVRGEILESAWILSAVGPASTRLSVEIQADPRGRIPKWIVNLFQSTWPRRTLERVRLQVKKPDVGVQAAVESLYSQAY